MRHEEIVGRDGHVIGIIADIDIFPPGTSFFGSAEDFLQIVSFNYPKGHVLRNHRHLYRKGPKIIRSEEIFIVFTGKIALRIFDDDDKFVKRTTLSAGEFYVVLGGGCGYTIEEENSRFLEVKCGPFPGSDIDRVLIQEDMNV